MRTIKQPFSDYIMDLINKYYKFEEIGHIYPANHRVFKKGELEKNLAELVEYTSLMFHP